METLKLQGANYVIIKLAMDHFFLIPGANGTGDIYMPLAKQLQKFTVVAVDRRGYGQSELTESLPEEVSNPESLSRET